MKPIETALLFANRPQFSAGDIPLWVNEALARFDQRLTAEADSAPGMLAFSGDWIRVEVEIGQTALPAESFNGALEGLLSDPFRGILSDVLFRHRRNMVIRLQPMTGKRAKLKGAERLTFLEMAHALTSRLARELQPAAVHWRQSNQLLAGAQYLRLAEDPAPWVLFARGMQAESGRDKDGKRLSGLWLEEFAGLSDRSIVVLPNAAAPEQSYAAALSFLRHLVQSGRAVADGHRFGTDPDHAVYVRHSAPTRDDPRGSYYLRLGPAGIDDGDQDGNGARAEGPLAALGRRIFGSEPRRGLASGFGISLLMLVLMPPLGLVLLVGDILFGASLMRSGMISLLTLAMAMLAAGWLTLTAPDRISARLSPEPTPISSQILP